MGVRARQIVRDARKLGITMSDGNYNFCATGVMAKAKGLAIPLAYDMFNQNAERKQKIADTYNLTVNQLDSIELGYEGPHSNDRLGLKKPHQTYVRLGERVAKMVGVTPW